MAWLDFIKDEDSNNAWMMKTAAVLLFGFFTMLAYSLEKFDNNGQTVAVGAILAFAIVDFVSDIWWAVVSGYPGCCQPFGVFLGYLVLKGNSLSWLANILALAITYMLIIIDAHAENKSEGVGATVVSSIGLGAILFVQLGGGLAMIDLGTSVNAFSNVMLRWMRPLMETSTLVIALVACFVYGMDVPYDTHSQLAVGVGIGIAFFVVLVIFAGIEVARVKYPADLFAAHTFQWYFVDQNAIQGAEKIKNGTDGWTRVAIVLQAWQPFYTIVMLIALHMSAYHFYGENIHHTLDTKNHSAASLSNSTRWILFWVTFLFAALQLLTPWAIKTCKLQDHNHVNADQLFNVGKRAVANAPTFTSATRDGDNNASYATVTTGDDCDADDAVVTTPLKQREPHFRV